MLYSLRKGLLHLLIAATLLFVVSSTQVVQSSETVERARELSRQSDQRRPEDQLLISLFDRPMLLGGQLDSAFDYRRDFELDASKKDDRLEIEGQIEVEVFYQWNERLIFFAEAKANFENQVYAEFDTGERDAQLERGQSWLYYSFDEDAKFAMQLGRQNFRDKREWWWDSELEALRLHYQGKKWKAQIAVASC